MSTSTRLSSVDFHNFKAFPQFSVALQSVNILVGPNNSGKSTILGSFRVLAEGIRRARARTPGSVRKNGRTVAAYAVPEDAIAISMENVHTDYSDDDSWITFRLSNGNSLELFFPSDGGCFLIPNSATKYVRTRADFAREFPVSVVPVPVLGPLEHEEPIVEEETIRIGLNTHRASRHFRNYWYRHTDGFKAFADLVARTWPGMAVDPPMRPDSLSRYLVMFAKEERITRELYWSGFGFQIWCQLLTHISRTANDTLLVIDEPEIYLHPDVQRQLLSVLREAGPDILLATHSVEIMGEAEASEILVVEKKKRSAQRLKNLEGVQDAVKALGSLQNFTLTQLARTRRVLFVEGYYDLKIIRRFAQRLGFLDVASGTTLSAVESGGLSSWERVKGTAWGIEKALGTPLAVAAVFDRDFMSDEEVAEMETQLQSDLRLVHIHARKEIENYLLIPEVLQRALTKAIRERHGERAARDIPPDIVQQLLNDLTESSKGDIQAQYIARRSSFLAREKRSSVTIARETISWCDERWRSLTRRLEIVAGKDVLSALRMEVQNRWQVNLTDLRIVNEFRREEVPADMATLVEQLDAYRN
jgi:energy-coupling factor transporter ATP-binding protein EcfA2